MKKRERIKKDHNITLFPDLDKRLLEKGLERLEQKKFMEAIDLLSKARSLDIDNEEICVGLVLAYFESGNYSGANKLVKEMLKMGIGEYFKVVDLYLMILDQQHQYEEIVITIEALLEEKEVPSEKIDHFIKLLQINRKKVENPKRSIPEKTEPIKEFELDLFLINNPNEQVHVAGQLAHSNVRAYIPELSEYLSSEEGDPFFKTMLLNVLKEQDYEKEVLVKKFSRQGVWIPSQLFDVHSHPDLLTIMELVRTKVENENPILLESIKQLLDRYFFLLYPLRTELDETNVWAAAFHFTACRYFGLESELTEIVELYQANQKAVHIALELIEGIEENSYS